MKHINIKIICELSYCTVRDFSFIAYFTRRWAYNADDIYIY